MKIMRLFLSLVFILAFLKIQAQDTGFVISSIKGVSLNIGRFVETDLIYDLNARLN
jgi:hypothetical protein